MTPEEHFASEDLEEREIPVLECNLRYLAVFSCCQPGLVAGFGTFVWRGITPVEILAACRLMRIKPPEWPDILENTQYLGHEVANYLNKGK